MTKNISVLIMLLAVADLGAAGKNLFNVLDYGAKPDGKTICTESINKAVTECNAKGGGQVYFPPGKYLSGTIVMRDHVELYLERNSVLLASTRHRDFPRMPQPDYRSQKDPGGWFALIYADEATDIGIRGYGSIDGQGKEQETRPESSGGDLDGRPRSILLISCKKIRIEGITMRSSGMWNQHYLNCEDLIIDKIEVYNHSSRNNDSLDIDGCRRVIVSNSILDSDDDGITLKSTGAAPCEDIAVTNCVISSFCNAIKAGTESTGGFENIAVSNCVIKPSRSKQKPIWHDFTCGLTGIALEIVDGGTMEGVTISNVTIEGTKCPLYVRLANRARRHTKDAPTPGVGVMRNIAISNLVCYNTGNFSSSITSIPGHYIENVSLNNIQFFNEGGLTGPANQSGSKRHVEDEARFPPGYIQSGTPEREYLATIDEVREDEKGYPEPKAWGNLPSSALFIRHAKNIMVQGVLVGSEATDPRVPIIAHDVEGLSIKNARVTGNNTANHFFHGKDVSDFDIEKPLGWKKKIMLVE